MDTTRAAAGIPSSRHKRPSSSESRDHNDARQHRYPIIRSITRQVGLPRLSVLDLFGSILTCQAYRGMAKFPKHAVETLVACSLMQFGEFVGLTLCIPGWGRVCTVWYLALESRGDDWLLLRV